MMAMFRRFIIFREVPSPFQGEGRVRVEEQTLPPRPPPNLPLSKGEERHPLPLLR